MSTDQFLWGAATAAYQIEGGVKEDGRTPSIWDTFSHTPGRTALGETGDIAADHYHRWEADLDLMAGLHLGAYRFSISWSRVQPGGRGPLNRAGVDFYRRLVAGQLERGIRPFVTLYHWDLPQELEDAGGWPHRATAEAFGEYAGAIGEVLAAEGVRDWFTVNEPWCTAFLGYASGVHAPGRTNPADALAAAHHLNLGHTLAARALRAASPDARVGAALNMRAVYPGNPDDPADVAAARKLEVIGDEIFIGPMLEGSYSPELLAMTDGIIDWGSLVRDGDLPTPAEAMDHVGVNYYYALWASARTADSPAGATGGHGASDHSPWVGCDDVVIHESIPPLTEMGWSVNPEGLARILAALTRRFPHVPLSITENGIATPDLLGADGGVHDADRIAYLRDHIQVLADARRAGTDLRSYFVWSLMDNFEWARGYSKRFGLVHVDYDTLVRTPKDSARWYADIAATGQTPEALFPGVRP